MAGSQERLEGEWKEESRLVIVFEDGKSDVLQVSNG